MDALRPKTMYRLYFLTGTQIIAAHVYEAADDRDAASMAAAICAAASDQCTGVEVWQGARLVAELPDAGFEERPVTRKQQENLVSVEIAIRNSTSAIAKSQRLLTRITELEQELRA